MKKASRYLWTGAVFVFLIWLVTGGGAQSAIPGRMNYQGRLADSTGSPIKTTKAIEFKIYDALSGGSVLWTSSSYSITPDSNGVFSVVLGSEGDPISSGIFSEATRYLEIIIEKEVMTPRIQFATSAFSFKSADSDYLAGLPPTEYYKASGGKITGNVTVEGGVVVTGTVEAVGFKGDGSQLTGVSASGISDYAVTSTKIATSAVTSEKIAASGVTSGSYGDGTHVGKFTVDAGGRITSAEPVVITGAAPSGEAGGELSGNYPNPTVVTGTTANKIVRLDASAKLPAIDASQLLNVNATSATTADSAGYAVTAGTATGVGTLSALSVSGTSNLTGVTTTGNFTVGSAGASIEASTGKIYGTFVGDGVLITGVAPSGAAGGALTGTYPNPTIASDANITTTGSISAASFAGNGAGLTNIPAVPGGATGAVQFNSSGSISGEATNLFYDVSTKRLGIGTDTPDSLLDISSNTYLNHLTINRPDASASFYLTMGSDGTTYFKNNTAERFRFNIIGSDVLNISTTGGLSLGNTYVSTDMGSGSMIMSGKLGIGTTSPTVSLEVVGGDVKVGSAGASIEASTGKVYGTFVGDGTFITGVAPSGAAGGVLTGTYPNPTIASDANVTTTGSISAGSFAGNGAGLTNVSAAAGGATGAVQFNSSGSISGEATNLFYDASTKRLGIGTSSPQAALDVNSGVIRNTNISLGSDAGKNRIVAYPSGPTIRILSAADAYANFGAAGLSIGASYAGTSPPSNGAIIAGNVGIGTTSPSVSLEVSGGDVKVGSAGASIEASTGKIYGTFVGDGSLLTNVTAATATSATTADAAGFATTAGTAITATSATTADASGYAVTSGTAESATSATTADAAGYAVNAGTAETVTNGVYTTGSYADPAWITSLASSKISGNVSVPGTFGGELAPSIVAGNWTISTGWENPIAGGVLNKNADGTGTAKPAVAITTTSTYTYKVVVVIDSLTVGSYATTSMSLGGVSWFMGNTAGTKTYYVTATGNANFIITPGNTDRIQISSISITEMSATASVTAGGSLEVSGDLIIHGPATRLVFAHPGDPSYASFKGGDERLSFYQGASEIFRTSSSGLGVANTAYPFGWVADVQLYRNATGQMGVSYYAAPAQFNIFSTYTSVTTPANYERLEMTGVVGSHQSITVGTAGTGTDDLELRLISAGTKEVIALKDDATTNATSGILGVRHTTSGTPANNIGAGLGFEVETSANNNEIVGQIDGIASDVTAAAEEGALVFKTMTGGAAAAERARIASGGLQLNAGLDIRPSSNSTTALNIAQADGTDFVIFDTTNKKMGIGATPSVSLEVNGDVKVGSAGASIEASSGNVYGTTFYGSGANLTGVRNLASDVNITTTGTIDATTYKAGGTSPVADGTYTVGIGAVQNGTITVKGGIITAIQEASN